MGARLRDCKGISRQTCCSLAWLISPEAVSGGEDVGVQYSTVQYSTVQCSTVLCSPEAVSGGEDVGVGEQGASAPVPVVPALQHLQQEQGQGGGLFNIHNIQ